MTTVFVTYSHADRKKFQELAVHLATLEGRKSISVWHDEKIKAGQDWNDEIQRKLEAADIALVLTSADFLNSEYVREHEMPLLLRRHLDKTLHLLPIFVRTTAKEVTSFEVLPGNGPREVNVTGLEGLNKPEQPLSKLKKPKREDVYKAAVNRIIELAEPPELEKSIPAPAPAPDPVQRARPVAAPEPPTTKETVDELDRPHAPPSWWRRHTKPVAILAIGLPLAGFLYLWGESRLALQERCAQHGADFMLTLGSGARQGADSREQAQKLSKLCGTPFYFGTEKILDTPESLVDFFEHLFLMARESEPRPPDSVAIPTVLKGIDLAKWCGKELDSGADLKRATQIKAEVDPKDRNSSTEARYNAPAHRSYYVLVSAKVTSAQASVHEEALLYVATPNGTPRVVGVKLR